MDRRVSTSRIAAVLRELDADVVALQEVLDGTTGDPRLDQLMAIADHLPGYSTHFGETRTHGGVPYGNAILSRVPVVLTRNYDLTWRRRERRGCLRADVLTRTATVHVFNVHLGTSFFERPHHARALLAPGVLGDTGLAGPRIVVGDFNEWTRGVASRLLGAHFETVDLAAHTRRRRTYPGLFPFLHLDHFYFDRRLRLVSFAVHRSRTALVASDHLPLVAEFEV